MNKTFFRMRFVDKDEIDHAMFREINEIIAKIRFEGYGKILAPRYEYFNGGIVNDLGNKMYVALHILHGDEHELRSIIRNEIESLGYNYSCKRAMPNFIEIFYNSSLVDSKIFENEFKAKIKECGGIIDNYSGLKCNYDSAVAFRVDCQINNFDDNIDVILNFLKKSIGDEYLIEYF